MPQYFLPVRGSRSGSALVDAPVLLAFATVRFVDPKAGVDLAEEPVLLTPVTSEAVPVSWERASETGVSVDDFRVRLQEATREERDALKERLRQKYAPKIAALQERLRRAQQTVNREKEQVTQQGFQTAISVGATILGAFLGRKSVSVGGIGRATTAARGAGRVLKERQDVGRAGETVQAVEQQLADLEAQFTAETAALETTADAVTERLEAVAVRPKKANITVKLCALVWAPHWRDAQGALAPAWE